jgi:Tol biopolymer transport system component
MHHPASKPSRVAALLLVALGIVACLPETASAQYFGRNQVQYRTFDFRILETENFDIYYYPEMEESIQDIARMSERWYARLSRILDHRFQERQPLIMYATHPHFQQTNIIAGIGEGTGGVTEAFKQRVVMPFSYSYEETDHILGHELVHAVQYDISGLGRAGGGIEAAARRFQVPLWFVEGMAEYLSVGPVDPHTAMWLRDGALRGDIPSIERMTFDPRIFPYRWGQALWAYVGGRWGDAAIGQILKLTGQGVPYPTAFQRILNISLEELSGDWHASIRRAYLPLLAERPEAREIARPLITTEREGGRLNVAPVLSPDGQWVVFLSELDFLDVQIHLANAQTGEVVRTLQKGTAFDPHFGSLRYISSAGTFSPDGSQFAFSALRTGHDVIAILDVARARRLREIRIPGVDEITNPNWSPDGRSIVFTGLVGGIPNLYMLDLETEQAEQLTDDRHTALHPTFSPDGRRIAFSTEMGPQTDFDILAFGPYRIAVMDLETREITMVPGMAGPKNINPQWTADGAGLFFISNRTGIPNIYRVEIATGALARVTDLFIGVSGITDVSPALTVARNGSRLLFTEFSGGGYNIYSLSEPRELAGTPVEPTVAAVAQAPAPIASPGPDGVTPVAPDPTQAPDGPLLPGDPVLLPGDPVPAPAPPQVAEADAVPANEVAAAEFDFPTLALLPPSPRPTEGAFNRVAQMLEDPLTGLPTVTEVADFRVVPYRPRLGLDYLGQPQVGVSVGGGAFGGGGLYGGIFGIFSDILARHQVFAAVQAQGQIDEVGFALQYLNQRERWNFGGAAQRIPMVYGRYSEFLTGQDFVQRISRVRIFDSSIQGFAQYPFSRVQRFEVSGGLRRVALDEQIFEFAFDRNTGLFRGERQDRLPGFSMNLFETSAALVYDSSLLGWTSPFAGQRYRFQLTPTFGQLQYLQALADYRRYTFLNPFTFATRGLHIGRYGTDAEAQVDGQDIFYDMYLGQPWYVRGYYDTYNRCTGGAQGSQSDCAVLRQLFGSRIGVASAELRFPLIRQLVVGTSMGLPPIEGFLFADAGIAWTQATTPVFTREVPADPLSRGIMTSIGAGARVNLFGMLIVEIDYVNPLASDRGWHWQFGFVPGF